MAGERRGLPFDPIDEAARRWSERYPEATRMHAVTSLMRVHQLVLTELDELLRPLGLTFARYEVLVLLSFTRHGELPLGKIGERLQVHATSVTSLVRRVAHAGLIERVSHPADRRALLARIPDPGCALLCDATAVVPPPECGLAAVSEEESRQLSRLLRGPRAAAGDF